jgi:hypothetical protein
MDSFSMLPTITVNELQERAAGFAKDLVEKLEKINLYSNAILTPEAQSYVDALPPEQNFHPAPSDYQHIFENQFYLYIASHYMIVPDEK